MITPARSGPLDSLRETDWEFFTETIALSWFGWSAAEQARNYARALRESVSSEAMQATMEAGRSIDVSALLADVQAPTLVLHRRDLRLPTLDAARELAAHIPSARLTVLEGEAGIPYVGDVEPVLQEINAFLNEGDTPTPDSAPAGMVTILFTDMGSSTALTQRLGDAKAQELVRAHNQIVRDALREHNGSEIKHTGDGIMASFATASSALQSAVVIQRAVAERAAEHPGLDVHIGLNAGEPVAEEQDLFGTAVQLARRICDAAGMGEILVSNVVRELAAGKGFLFSDRGDAALRGFEDPVRLWELRWREG
jgi:class 3 adenylate cyclase